MVMVFLTSTMGKQEITISRYLMKGFAFTGLFYPRCPLPVSEADSMILLKPCSSFVGIRAPVCGGKTWCPKERPGTVLGRMESSSFLAELPAWECGGMQVIPRLPLKIKGLK